MTDTNIRTADNMILVSGDRAYNYYDMKPGAIAEPPDSSGWFTFAHDDGTSALLNGERICSMPTARRRGYPNPDPEPRCYSCGARPNEDHTIGCYA